MDKTAKKVGRKKGFKHSEETKRKIREARKKQVITKNMLKSLKLGRKRTLSKETRKRLSDIAKARKLYLLGLEARKGKKRPDNAGRLKKMWKEGKIKPYWTGKKRPNMRGEKNPCWNNGSSLTYYRKNSAELKEKIEIVKKRDNFTCQVCGKKGEVTHHIDYNRKNNSVDNLIFLCRSCHAKTNFNRKDWQAFFQGSKKTSINLGS